MQWVKDKSMVKSITKLQQKRTSSRCGRSCYKRRDWVLKRIIEEVPQENENRVGLLAKANCGA